MKSRLSESRPALIVQSHMTILIRLFAGMVVAVLLPVAPRTLADETPAFGSTNSKIINQDTSGSVTLFAKDATPHGTMIRYEPQPHKNTIGYWTRREDWVSWEFSLHTPGNFTVELTQACGKGSGGSDYTVTIGNQILTNKVSDTGAFTNFVKRIIANFKLDKPGGYTISVKPLTKPGLAVMDLRAITLVPDKTTK